jgi:hypothetical protein
LEHCATHLAKRSHRLPGSGVDVGDQLNLTGVQLSLDGPLDLAKPLEHRRRVVRQTPGEQVDQEQLLFDPDRERLTGAEAVIALMLHSHVLEVCRGSRSARTPPSDRAAMIYIRHPITGSPHSSLEDPAIRLLIHLQVPGTSDGAGCC